MKNSFIALFLLSFISFSCQNQVNPQHAKTEKMNIQLNVEHPNKKQMEWFLNNYEEEFVTHQEHNDSLMGEHLIQEKYYFQTKSSNILLTLIFCNNQQDALTIGVKNYHNQKYGVNGAVLFVIDGKDNLKVDSMLSWFSGEE